MRITAIALLMTMALSFLEARSQEPADTVAAYKNVTDVLVTRSGDTTKVTANVIGKDGEKLPFEYEVSVVENDTVGEIELADNWGINVPFYKSEPKKRPIFLEREVVVFEDAFWGWRFNYHDKGQVKNCYEIGIRQLIGVSWSKGDLRPSPFTNYTSFSIGLGFSHQRYNAQDDFAYNKVGDKISLVPIGGLQRVKSSHMYVWSLNVPVQYKHKFTKNLHFSIGGIANLNFYANAKTEILEDKIKHKVKFKGLQQNLFTADAYASFGFDVFSVYVSWSPMNLFSRQYGPELRAWSVGVNLFSFWNLND